MENNIEKLETEEGQEAKQEPASLLITGKKTPKLNKKLVIIIAVIFAIGVLTYIFRGYFIAAMVNGTPISRLSVIKELEKASGKQALGSIITQMLIKEEANKKGFAVTDDEVNSELKNIEDQLKSQGQALDQALAGQGMTIEELKKQIVTQKELEKLLAGQNLVTSEEIEQYIKDNNIEIPAGQELTYKEQLRSQLEQQKFSQAASALIDSLKSQAKIQYFVNY